MREEIQEEAIQIALKNKHCTLNLTMRLGKTKIGLEVASKFERVLVCYPLSTIKESWMNDSKKFNISIEHVTFSTYRSIEKHKLDDYDLVIFDEVQAISIQNWLHVSQFNISRILALSGTVPRQGSEKRGWVNKFCPVMYSKTLDDTAGVVTKDYKIYIHLLSPSNKNDIPLSKGRMWSERAKIAFWDNKYRSSKNFMDMLKVMQAIQNSKTKLDYAVDLAQELDRALIFVETIEQCSLFPYPSYHSKNKESEENLEKFREYEEDKLVSVKQLGAGVTIPVSKCIITHCYSSNDKAAQRLARCLNYTEEGDVAEVHIIGLKATRDEQWIEAGLEAFDKTKIIYIKE